jgi:antagonist of KipI
VIHVKAPGLLTTVQDRGRDGFGPMGVSPSGAADPIALRVGNMLVGNADRAAALEMTLLGGSFMFDEDCVVALTGSDFGAKLDAEPRQTWTSFNVTAGQTLRMEQTQSGARCYLCVRGGILVPLLLGSASTHLLSGLGGYHGRALRKGDILEIGRGENGAGRGCIDPEMLRLLAPRKELRVTPGLQWEWFTGASKQAFCRNTYRVTEESNRMGLRLEGRLLQSTGSGRMISEGVPLGAIQVPASGQPVILFVEQQTTGGYPKIANIIAADLPSVGQLRPRDEISFELVAPEVARNLLRGQEDLLRP